MYKCSLKKQNIILEFANNHSNWPSISRVTVHSDRGTAVLGDAVAYLFILSYIFLAVILPPSRLVSDSSFVQLQNGQKGAEMSKKSYKARRVSKIRYIWWQNSDKRT